MSSSLLMTDPLFILSIGIIIVVGGIIGFKLHPFIALLLGALVVGVLTPASVIEQYELTRGATSEAALQLSNRSVGERVAVGFGNTCGKIGILIAMAAIIGKCMLESGAAEKIVRSILKLTGIRQAPSAFLVSSFFLGIPVFYDTVVLLMIPLAKTMAMRLGKNYLLFILAIMAGAAMANSLVPPAPGPLFLVGEMQLSIGTMMIAGTILGLFTITAGYLYALWANKKWPIPLRDALDARLEDIKAASLRENTNLPSLGISLLPVLIPLLLICANTALSSFKLADTTTASFFMNKLTALISFFGDKNMALISGGLVALLLLAMQKKESGGEIAASVQAALMSGGGIILITAAGGAFGSMLQQTGISSRIAILTQGYQMALIPLAFLIAAVVRTAQGSATVALITASGILSGMAHAANLPYHPLYLGLAIGCGSKVVPWMNDSGFWIACRMCNLTEREALKTFSPMLAIMGVTGLIVLLIAVKFMPLI